MDSRPFLRTLGQPALFAPNGDPLRFRVKKHLGLLVYLAVEPRVPQRRDHLADLLWPGATAAEGRHSLATALSVLRARLGREAIETTRETIRLAPDALSVDLDRLEAGDVLGDDTGPPLEVAGFLDGFELADADEFLRWKERQQARLLPLVCRALVLQIDRCRRTADSRRMERLADRMLALDPLSEDGVRAKMEARAFAGDRLTALRVFEAWKEELARELGAVPSDLVEGIAIRLRRRGWERTSASHIPAVPTDQWRDRPFVGRTGEYRVLYEAWERTRRGEPGHVLVRGDSGVGKSTLVARLSTAAALEGATVSRVQCYELEREIPYAAVTSLVTGLLDKPGASAAPPEALAELSRTVPAVRQRFPAIPPAMESQGETARVRLAEAMHRLLLAVADEHPVILVVDDLHLADDASLAVLHLVIRHAKAQPIMVALTVRPGELGRAPHAGRLLEVAPTLGFRMVDLPPMTEEESAALLDALVPAGERRPPLAVRRAILTAAAGYPMVLELLLQDWQVHGDQALALSLTAMTSDLGGPPGSDGPYERLFAQLAGSLDSVTRAVLNLAAILGRRLNDLDLYGLVDLTMGQTMAGLAHLAAIRVLRDSGRGLEFVNELIRASAYRAIPSPVRRALHSKIADRLLADGAEPRHGLEIAWHCFRAGRKDEATPHLLDGAAAVMRTGAPHEAERALVTALPNLSATAKSRAVVLLTEALQEQGRWDESLSVLDTHANDLIGDDESYGRVLRVFASLKLDRLSDAERAEAMEELCQIGMSGPRLGLRIRAIAAASALSAAHRDEQLARRLYSLAGDLASESLEPDELVRLEGSRAVLAYELGEMRSSRRHFDDALRHAERHAIEGRLALRLRIGVACHMMAAGCYADAVRMHLQALHLAERLHSPDSRAAISGNLVVCYGRLGNLPEMMRHAEAALADPGMPQRHYGILSICYWKAVGHALAGERADALGTLAAAIRHPSGDQAPVATFWTLMRADVLLLLGSEQEAQRQARRVIQYRTAPPQIIHYEGLVARWTALAAVGREELLVANQQLTDIGSNLERLDAIDQLELLSAIVHTRQRLGMSVHAERAMMRERMANLPPATVQLLAKLRMPTDCT